MCWSVYVMEKTTMQVLMLDLCSSVLHWVNSLISKFHLIHHTCHSSNVSLGLFVLSGEQVCLKSDLWTLEGKVWLDQPGWQLSSHVRSLPGYLILDAKCPTDLRFGLDWATYLVLCLRFLLCIKGLGGSTCLQGWCECWMWSSEGLGMW